MKIKVIVAMSLVMGIFSAVNAKPAEAKAAFVACQTALAYWGNDSCSLVQSDGQGGLLVASCNNHLIIYNRNCFDSFE